MCNGHQSSYTSFWDAVYVYAELILNIYKYSILGENTLMNCTCYSDIELEILSIYPWWVLSVCITSVSVDHSWSCFVFFFMLSEHSKDTTTICRGNFLNVHEPFT